MAINGGHAIGTDEQATSRLVYRRSHKTVAKVASSVEELDTRADDQQDINMEDDDSKQSLLPTTTKSTTSADKSPETVNVDEHKTAASNGSDKRMPDPPPDQKLGLFTTLGLAIVLTQIVFEVSKQTANFSLQYYHDGVYPIPNTFLVVLTELTKLTAILIISKGQCPISRNGLTVRELRNSAKYLVPSLLYGINNNLYLIGLTLVAPPIWIILVSIRTVITACVYKFVLKRQLTPHQLFGAFLIVISLTIAKAPDIMKILTADDSVVQAVDIAAGKALPPTVNAVPLSAILLAIIASSISVTAAIYTERLFKSGNDTFLDQQFWLYLYGATVALIIHTVNKAYFLGSFLSDLNSMGGFLRFVLCVAVFFGSIGGLVTASILKHLDNVVKEYSASCANIAVAVVCSFLFPDKFQFTVYMMMSMAVLLTGIFFYERFKAKPKASVINKPA